MKKKLIIICAAVLAAVLCAVLYVVIGSSRIQSETWDYLKDNGYSESDFRDVTVRHSFAALLLSYDEWSIGVVYNDEPASTYMYTMRDGDIVLAEVDSTLDKSELRHG